MRLVFAGSPHMQRALEHRYVRAIASILLQHPDLLNTVAFILKTYDQRAQAGLVADLDHIRLSWSRPGDTGLMPPTYIIELVQTLHDLYQQRNEEITYQRGAILEVLAYMLVSPRYTPGECQSDYRFVDEQGNYVTEQIDIAALSRDKKLAEGYECKLKANGIASSHCTGLAYLANIAEQEGYHANVGFVALDDERIISRRIARFHSSPALKAYGLNRIWLLRTDPF